MRKQIILLCFSLILILLFGEIDDLFGRDDELVLKIDNLKDRYLVINAFELREKLPLQIEALGQEGRDRADYRACAWILDGASRRLVWDFNSKSARRTRKRDEVLVRDEVILPAGYYEMYYAVNPSDAIHVKNFYGVLSELWTQLKSRENGISPEWGIKLFCDSGKNNCSVFELGDLRNDHQAIVQLIENGDDSYETAGFSLSRKMDLKIYALGEGYPKKREMFDYAWIIDANSRKRVWEMQARHTEHAGGSKKNRMFDDIITLPAGDYLVYYVTDDSHSYDSWNTMPPHDPRYWGITIWGTRVNESDTFIKPFQEDESVHRPFIEITRMRNDEYESQSFRLNHPASLRIYALGESYSRRKMADYGWIIDSRTREKVWEMEYRETEHAGGGRKNRVYDQIIELPAGSYTVYYVTDDSHAYQSWNAGPPFDPESWGISIWGASDDFYPEIVESIQADENPDLIAQIIRVGDDEKLREKFTLSEVTRVRVYALGEGHRSEMYDFGWIEKARGDIIWEMTYRKTESAGGARKNRRVNQVITLEAGTYYLYYRSDDSHSYAGWNAAAPDDPLYWGITLTRE